MAKELKRVRIVNEIPRNVAEPVIYLTDNAAQLLCPYSALKQSYDITDQLNPKHIDQLTKDMGLYVIGSGGGAKSYSVIGDKDDLRNTKLVKYNPSVLSDLESISPKSIITINVDPSGNFTINDFRKGKIERLDAKSAERTLSDYGIIYLKK